MASSNKQLGPLKKLPTSGVAPVMKTIFDTVVGSTPKELAINLAGGKLFTVGARAVAGITKKGAKYVNNVYKNMEN